MISEIKYFLFSCDGERDEGHPKNNGCHDALPIYGAPHIVKAAERAKVLGWNLKVYAQTWG